MTLKIHKKSLHAGFGLLEVVFALAISVVLTTILFQALNQTNKVLAKIITVSQRERTVNVVQQLWDREFSGVFIPRIAWSDQQAEQQEDGPAPKPDTPESKKEQDSKEQDKKDTDTQKNEVPQPFVCEVDEAGNLKMFTFITTNALCTYAEPQVRMTRVMYRLEPDPANKGEFLLVHQQSEDLDPKRFVLGSHNAARSYQVMSGIKACKVEFLIDKPEKEDDKKDTKAVDSKKPDEKKLGDTKQDAPVKKIRQFETLKQWKEKEKPDPKKEVKKEENKQPQKKPKKEPELPVFIHITLTILDDTQKSHTYDYWYAPLYDTQPAHSKKIIGMASAQQMQNNKSVFDEHQQFFADAGAMV